LVKLLNNPRDQIGGESQDIEQQNKSKETIRQAHLAHRRKQLIDIVATCVDDVINIVLRSDKQIHQSATTAKGGGLWMMHLEGATFLVSNQTSAFALLQLAFLFLLAISHTFVCALHLFRPCLLSIPLTIDAFPNTSGLTAHTSGTS